MVHVIMSGPIKPLTKVERAFAAERLRQIRHAKQMSERIGSSAGMTLLQAQAFLEVSKSRTLQYKNEHGWRAIGMGFGSGGPVVYSTDDIVATAEKRKQMRK